MWSPVENGNWLLTLSTLRGERPPTESSAVLESVAAFGESFVLDQLKAAEAATRPFGFRDTGNRRR